MDGIPDFPEFALTPLSGSLGAEIRGLNLSEPITPELGAAIERAFTRFHMLCIRDQKLSLDDYRRFARLFGPFSGNPIHVAMPDYPEFVRVVKEPFDEGPTFGGGWHTDLSWFEAPPKATMLYAEEVPPWGGDTLFANLHLAWDRLTPTFRAMLGGQVAIHSGYGTYNTNAALKSIKVVEEGWEVSQTEVEHPLVPRHPDTDRPFLFINPNVVRIKGMTDAESRPILDYLMKAATRPDLTCRVTWKAGSITVWDNRCLMHHAIGDYRQFRRIVYRTTIAGDKLPAGAEKSLVEA
jgi:alpha-ketoglutarate-dependent taurine dioxygenase